MTCSRGCCPDYRTHIKGVHIGSFPDAQTYREKKLVMDMRAFKSLRDDGLQPPRVDGSYVLERNAKDKLEVELGRPVDPLTRAVMEDSGCLPSQP